MKVPHRPLDDARRRRRPRPDQLHPAEIERAKHTDRALARARAEAQEQKDRWLRGEKL